MTKPPISLVSPIALIHCAMAMKNGAVKYGPYNWRDEKVSASIYIDAAMRHLLDWADGEEVADDSKVHHLGHAMACCAILMDAQAVNQLVDDRHKSGLVPALLASLTEKKPAETAPAPAPAPTCPDCGGKGDQDFPHCPHCGRLVFPGNWVEPK